MSDHGSTEENVTGNSSENVEGEVFEIQTLTQEAVNEQIRAFVAPLTRKLEELTRLVQGMVTTPHPSHYPRTDFGATCGIATYQSDIWSSWNVYIHFPYIRHTFTQNNFNIYQFLRQII